MKKMLVIEDDELTQNIYSRIFKSDFEIDFAESSEKYHQDLSEKIYDIVIIDISLKGSKNGIELISEFKKNPIFNSIPLLCITAHAFNADKVKAIDAGTDVFLVKPVDNKVLRNIVASLINK